jgi:hypothetical protein
VLGLENLLVGLHNGPADDGLGLIVAEDAGEFFLQLAGEDLHGVAAGDLAGVLPAHAVGHQADGHVGEVLDVNGVLVVSRSSQEHFPMFSARAMGPPRYCARRFERATGGVSSGRVAAWEASPQSLHPRIGERAGSSRGGPDGRALRNEFIVTARPGFASPTGKNASPFMTIVSAEGRSNTEQESGVRSQESEQSVLLL